MINQKLSQKSITIICCFYELSDAALVQLQDLRALIQASQCDVEVVLVTFEGDIKLATRYVDKIVKDDGKGIYHAMNLGLRNASKEYVNFNNLGDYLYSIPELCGRFDLYAYSAEIYSNNKWEYTRYPLMKNRRMPCHQAIFTRRILHPLFKTGLRYTADLDFYLNFVGSKRLDEKIICKFNLGGVSNKISTIPRRKLERMFILSKICWKFFRQIYESLRKR